MIFFNLGNLIFVGLVNDVGDDFVVYFNFGVIILDIFIIGVFYSIFFVDIFEVFEGILMFVVVIL